MSAIDDFDETSSYSDFHASHKVIENLEALVNLEELWLGKNKITKLEVRT